MSVNRRDWVFHSQDGTVSVVKKDLDGNIYQVQNHQDITAILKENERLRNDPDYNRRRANTQEHWHHIGTIPNLIYYDLLKKFGPHNENPKAWENYLRNNKHLLTTSREI